MWIVDSGGSEHMIGDLSHFQHYKPCQDGLMVKIADGSFSKVVGTSSIMISKDLELKTFLYVSNLDCNLLSMGKISHVLLNFPQICVNFRSWIQEG